MLASTNVNSLTRILLYLMQMDGSTTIEHSEMTLDRCKSSSTVVVAHLYIANSGGSKSTIVVPEVSAIDTTSGARLRFANHHQHGRPCDKPPTAQAVAAVHHLINFRRLKHYLSLGEQPVLRKPSPALLAILPGGLYDFAHSTTRTTKYPLTVSFILLPTVHGSWSEQRMGYPSYNTAAFSDIVSRFHRSIFSSFCLVLHSHGSCS